MKKQPIIWVLLLVFTLSSFKVGENKTKQEEDKTEQTPIEKWRNARFGMFMHWGVYSTFAGEYNGVTSPWHYSEHLMAQFRIPVEEYKEQVASKFNPQGFNADEWVKTIKETGMGYIVITAKHHDGFAMYDSKVSDYNVVDATPYGKDPLRELRDACKRQGILFGFYYSHAQDWGHPNGVRNTWDYPNNPASRKWKKENPDYFNTIKKYYDEKAIPQIIELITEYDPDIFWFDTAFWGPAELNRLCVDTAFSLKPELIINSRGEPSYDRCTYKSTSDKPFSFPPESGDWEAIPSTSESYGFHQLSHTHGTGSFYIQLLANASAKGGNVLLNCGPRGDGKIDEVDLGIFKDIGRWMSRNRESIQGTIATTLPIQGFGPSTQKNNTLYLHVFNWPKNGELYVGGIKSDVIKARMLTHPNQEIKVSRINEKDILIHLPQKPQELGNTVIALACETLETDNVRLLSPNIEEDVLHVFDGDLIGKHLRFGKGNHKSNSVLNWKDMEQSVQWSVRLLNETTYDVFVSYDALKESDGNTFKITLGGSELMGQVVGLKNMDRQYLGRVTLKPGEFYIGVKAEHMNNYELMRLRSIHLISTKNKN